MSNALLLVNLGTPHSPETVDVKRFLNRFLTDRRVIDLPFWKRQLLVRGLIVPRRYRASAAAYRKIWQKEGSPLRIYSEKVTSALQSALGNDYMVTLAMRYGAPSLQEALATLEHARVSRLMVLPLFPQYSSATTGSLYQQLFRILSRWRVMPKLTTRSSFGSDPLFIEAFCQRILRYDLSTYDHILFSYHGLTEDELKKLQIGCLQRSNCCQQASQANRGCYGAQCVATTQALVERLELDSTHYTHCYQSRLGKRPRWIGPYLSDVTLQRLAQGDRRLLVVSPAFVCDCLETLYEIEIELKELFISRGGQQLDLVEGLNDSPVWIKALKSMVEQWV